MKKLILPLLLLAIIATLFLRFIEVDVAAPAKTPPPKNCLEAADPSGKAVDPNGEPLATCAELEAINQAYQKDVKPIFAAKCLMCHGTVNKMPLYSKVPPISFLVNHDIEEAQEHADMTFDFPFSGKHIKAPQEGLEDLIEVVQENDMPPFIYKTMHWKSGLSPEESKIILEWARAGLKTLHD